MLQNIRDWAAGIYFLIVLKAEHPRSVLSVLVSRISLPALQRATFLLCLHMAFPLSIQERGGAGGLDVSPFSFKDSSPIELESHPHDINHLLKGPISKYIGSWGFNIGT